MPVKAEVWTLARLYWERSQKSDGSWAYTPESPASTASMTCAGVSSLIISGMRRFQGQEFLQGDEIENCGKGAANPSLKGGIDWLARNFQVGENFGAGQQWKFYYLYGLERAGRLAGIRYFGTHDWYRLGAEELVQKQDKLAGFWQGALMEHNDPPILATSFAVLFLAKGRAPVLINKLRHLPTSDWNNDPDDVRNLVDLVSRDWKSLLTWQVVDPGNATVQDLLQAPILFFNGHRVPEFAAAARQNIREYVEQGGFLFVDACCGEPEFDQGFRRLIKEIFPEEEYQLRPLPPEHPIWRARMGPQSRDPSALGHRARLPDRGDLLAQGPLLLLEPDGAQPQEPGRRQRGQDRPERDRLRHRPRDARRQAGRPRDPRLQERDAQARGPADRQAHARRRLEHRPAGDPQPHGRPPQAPVQLRRRPHPEGPLPPRSRPDLLPADLHPRPRRALLPQGGPRRPAPATSSPAAAPSSPTRPAAARPSTPPSAASPPS